MKRFLLRSFVIFTAWCATTHASVRIVPDDFATPQDAINAAVDGDVILVRAGAYPTFVLDKGVMLRALGSAFSITGPTSQSRVTVSGIGALQKAGISGMYMGAGWTAGPRLLVQGCAGEVVLENITIDLPDTVTDNNDNRHLEIADCANVALTTFRMSGYVTLDKTPDAAVVVQRSSVRMTDVLVRGLSNLGVKSGLDGGDAIDATDAKLVVALPDVQGGRGGDAVYCDMGTGQPTPGGDGGHGIAAVNSTVIVMGGSTHAVRGGDGGDGEFGCPTSDGGSGGDGVHQSGTGSVVVSRVALVAGSGGDGSPFGGSAGADGHPASGNVVRDDRFPYLSSSGAARPGQTLTLTLDAVVGGHVIMLFAGHGGFASVGGIGPELSVLPGQWFLVFPVGSITPPSVLNLPLLLPSDDVVRGLPINTQAIIVDASSALYLSNSLVRVIGG